MTFKTTALLPICLLMLFGLPTVNASELETPEACKAMVKAHDISNITFSRQFDKTAPLKQRLMCQQSVDRRPEIPLHDFWYTCETLRHAVTKGRLKLVKRFYTTTGGSEERLCTENAFRLSGVSYHKIQVNKQLPAFRYLLKRLLALKLANQQAILNEALRFSLYGFASNPAFSEALFEVGVKPYAVYSDRENFLITSAFHSTWEFGKCATARFMIAKSTPKQLATQNKYGETALIQVIKAGSHFYCTNEEVLLAKKTASLNVQDDKGNTALHYLLSKQISTCGDSSHPSPLDELRQVFLERGASLVIANKNGVTANALLEQIKLLRCKTTTKTAWTRATTLCKAMVVANDRSDFSFARTFDKTASLEERLKCRDAIDPRNKIMLHSVWYTCEMLRHVVHKGNLGAMQQFYKTSGDSEKRRCTENLFRAGPFSYSEKGFSQQLPAFRYLLKQLLELKLPNQQALLKSTVNFTISTMRKDPRFAISLVDTGLAPYEAFQSFRQDWEFPVADSFPFSKHGDASFEFKNCKTPQFMIAKSTPAQLATRNKNGATALINVINEHSPNQCPKEQIWLAQKSDGLDVQDSKGNTALHYRLLKIIKTCRNRTLDPSTDKFLLASLKTLLKRGASRQLVNKYDLTAEDLFEQAKVLGCEFSSLGALKE